MKRLYLLTAALTLVGCPYRLGESDPYPQKAREVHSSYLKSESGFGVDTSRPIFYDSFEATVDRHWELLQTGSKTSGDAWKTTDKQANFGSKALTYGENDVITKDLTFGTAMMTSKAAVSLASAKNPVLIVFAGYQLTGSETDQTAFRVEASSDLGFSWTPLVPTGAATDSISEPVLKQGANGSIWKRFEYSLAKFKGGDVRLRLNLNATASSRKLVFIDDVLIAEK
jgi:hypothetical protein